MSALCGRERQSQILCQQDRGQAIVRFQLAIQPVQVGVDRTHGDAQATGDGRGGESLRQHVQHYELARGDPQLPGLPCRVGRLAVPLVGTGSHGERGR